MTATNLGLVRQGTGHAVLKAIPIPRLPDDYLLVRTVCIALNPTDWTTLEAPGDDGTLVGVDYSGIVEAVGSRVQKAIKKGDRVAGFAQGGNDANPETGAFATYIIVKGDLQLHIPDGVTFEEACTIGSGIATTGYALYKVLKLPPPDLRRDIPKGLDKHILIYGGSTVTGTIATQFAKLSGWNVITTCSPWNLKLLEDRGADAVFDYRDPDISPKIREASANQLSIVLDAVGLESSAKICADAICPRGGLYCSLLPVQAPRDDVESVFFLGYNMVGEDYIFEGEKYDAQPEDYAFASTFMPLAETLWAQGKVKPHPQRIGGGGFQGAIEGMREMKEGKYSGIKLVYRVDDTHWPEDMSSV